MPWYTQLIIIYLGVMAVVSVFTTVIDKASAKRGGWRIPEATLMTLGLFGGALPMFITMRVIRHKTKHKKFMIGLPLEIALHTAILCSALWFYFNN